VCKRRPPSATQRRAAAEAAWPPTTKSAAARPLVQPSANPAPSLRRTAPQTAPPPATQAQPLPTVWLPGWRRAAPPHTPLRQRRLRHLQHPSRRSSISASSCPSCHVLERQVRPAMFTALLLPRGADSCCSPSPCIQTQPCHTPLPGLSHWPLQAAPPTAAKPPRCLRCLPPKWASGPASTGWKRQSATRTAPAQRPTPAGSNQTARWVRLGDGARVVGTWQQRGAALGRQAAALAAGPAAAVGAPEVAPGLTP
jgi:hypothetical protein